MEDLREEATAVAGLPGVDTDGEGEERLERLDWLTRSLSINRLCFFKFAASFTTAGQRTQKGLEVT